MKKILLFCFLSPLWGLAQVGKILPNEIQPLQRLEKRNSPSHNFNASSEVFIKISDFGRFRVIIDDQIIENSTGMFRFFDLTSGKHTLHIYEGNILIYRTSILTKNHHRLMLDYNYNDLFIVDEIPLQKHSPIPSFPNHFGKRIMNDRDFNNFLHHFNQQSFDNDKLKTFNSQNKSVAFSSEQIVKMITKMSFDKNKITLAKSAFRDCVDPENFYRVVDALDFLSSKNELKDFISKY